MTGCRLPGRYAGRRQRDVDPLFASRSASAACSKRVASCFRTSLSRSCFTEFSSLPSARAPPAELAEIFADVRERAFAPERLDAGFFEFLERQRRKQSAARVARRSSSSCASSIALTTALLQRPFEQARDVRMALSQAPYPSATGCCRPRRSVRAMREQQFHHRAIAVSGGSVQAVHPPCWRAFASAPCSKQLRHGSRLPSRSRGMQRRIFHSVRRTRIDVGTSVQQRLREFRLAEEGGQMKRCPAVRTVRLRAVGSRRSRSSTARCGRHASVEDIELRASRLSR